ncbi:MAG: hypothetical protein ACTSWQ_05010 [Candidatus Thorarchaeota archaeon]
MKTYTIHATKVGESKAYAKFVLDNEDAILAHSFKGYQNTYYFSKDLIGEAKSIVITVEVPE